MNLIQQSLYLQAYAMAERSRLLNLTKSDIAFATRIIERNLELRANTPGRLAAVRNGLNAGIRPGSETHKR